MAGDQRAIAHGKHIISEKPLASSATEAQPVARGGRCRHRHAVTFNYRGNPLVQQARAMISAATSVPCISSMAVTCRTGC
jgi:predicted dehydrogenase